MKSNANIGFLLCIDCIKVYRFRFNGKELDKEGMGGVGNTYDYGFRIYNAQLGRFLSVDPLTYSFPYYTPYQYAGNKPIVAVDLDGLEDVWVHQLTLSDGTTTSITIINGDDTFEATKAQLCKDLHIDPSKIPDNGVMSTSGEQPQIGGDIENIRFNYSPAMVVSENRLNFIDNYYVKIQGEKGFTKFRTDLGEGLGKSSTYVKGAGIIATFILGPEAGIPIYESGAYLENTANALKGLNAIADEEYGNASLEFGSIFLGVGAGRGAKQLGKLGADEVQQFGASSLTDIFIDKTKDALKTAPIKSTETE